ncbi:hypothetical protein BKA82DRAFT_597179 [Pisolithus tinctorius]|uniref:Uncharacterized protein n=1 Tax=Pisolithus tinctorius Marx 270 TaxID=870435 RepID=A0A0C3P8D4_PISTI|nr:hypothetical protein BKA82DRAFT_597179 [Pisolithus tinctorius]KIO03966.1 hypothetical protein M404DRAFT_597179 [Pisolithus tinctorius Marx 270]
MKDQGGSLSSTAVRTTVTASITLLQGGALYVRFWMCGMLTRNSSCTFRIRLFSSRYGSLLRTSRPWIREFPKTCFCYYWGDSFHMFF